MEKRRVTVSIDGKYYSFYSDDSDEYISALEQRTNAAMKQTESFAGSSAYTNAVLTVLLLTDKLMRTEQKGDVRASDRKSETEVRKTAGDKKNITKAVRKDDGQVSVWDLLEKY